MITSNTLSGGGYVIGVTGRAGMIRLRIGQ